MDIYLFLWSLEYAGYLVTCLVRTNDAMSAYEYIYLFISCLGYQLIGSILHLIYAIRMHAVRLPRRHM